VNSPIAHLAGNIDDAYNAARDAKVGGLSAALDAVAMVGYQAGWDAHLRLQFDLARAMPDTVRALYAERDVAVAEAAMLDRQLQSIIEHCDRARFGLVLTSEIYRLIITDPADEEDPR
jgi:hypothetical protein